MPEEIDTSEDHLLVDLSDAQPLEVTTQLETIVNQLAEYLYELGCGINGLTITVPDMNENTSTTIPTDFGDIHIVPEEI